MPPIKRLLMTELGYLFYVTDVSKDYHTKLGYIKKVELKKKEGSVLTTNLGKKLILLKPQYTDQYAKLKRGPQTIPRKDIGYIIANVLPQKNWTILEAGSGSGALTCALAPYVKKIISYEVRLDHHALAKKNATQLGLKNITFKHKDIYDGIDEKKLDALILDLPEPWMVLPHATKALKAGGFLVAYCPTIMQTADFVNTLSTGFVHIKTSHIVEDQWEVHGRRVRPDTRAIGHSGFISIARKAT